MRKLIIICMVLLFLVGCGQKQTETKGTGSQFVGGTNGLSLEFVEGTPPPEVLDQNQPFGISLKLSNLGEYSISDVSKATVKLSGFDPADFGVTQAELQQQAPEELRGAQKDIEGNLVQGTVVTMDFPAGGGSFQHQQTIAGSVTYNVRAEVCYDYGTTANAKLCVLKDLLGTQGKQGELCEVNEAKTVDQSGSPVQVTGFTESVSSSNKVAFVFKVSHTQSGTVHELGSSCDPDFNKKNKVHVKVDTGMTDGLTCSGLQNGATSGSLFEGDATLLNGEREIRCTQTINNPTDLEKLVRIDLTYEYDQFISKDLEVKHLG